MSRRNIGSIPSPFSKPISNSSARNWSRPGGGSACSSMRARAICCSKPNARNFLPTDGLPSPQPFSGLGSRRKNFWLPPNGGQRSEIRGQKGRDETTVNHQRAAKNMATIEAHGLRKIFGTTVALDGINLRVEEGRILGIIGPNGAGKTTALNAILGLTSYDGQLTVLGRDPWNARDQLMRDVSFIADVAVLPRWIRVSQLLDYVAGVHPKFDRAKAEGFLTKTTIKCTSKVRQLSKGMVAQLHLALVMAIDAKLLVLDEPTLGLDILYRKQFYDSLLNDYFDKSRTIVVTTHQVEEVQDVLTDLMFIDRGKIVLECSMEEFESRYLEVMLNPEHLAEARAFKPIHVRSFFGRSVMLFDGANREQVAALGEVRRPSIADLVVAAMSREQGGS